MTTQNPTPAPDSPLGPVTLLGLGPMGTALAHVLVDRGHPLTVWNRTPEKAAALVAKGARLASTVDEAVAASPVTITCLKDYAAQHAILGPAGDALRGRALINLNSGTPAEANEAAGWAAGLGLDHLDGAVMVPPTLVGRPGSVLLYSGSRTVFERHRAVLAALGEPRYLGADPGLAVLHNTALLEMMYTTVNGWLHASALVGSAGVSAAEFADLALGWFMPTVLDPASLLAQAPLLDRGEYPGDLGTLEMNLTALDHLASTSEERGIDATQPRLLRALAARGVAEGHGAENYFSLFEVLRRASPDRPVRTGAPAA
ncbi:NAD(P)-dependent oxidoreductase [Streptomyces sp. NPDC002454]|uniref:NAD(P)-dependent oxidoreductase n=1 Tax=Streptomyces sp. NPDC002490 TaxID=3154416 RepID=UPI00332B93A2